MTYEVTIRRANLEDAEAMGQICHDAFADIAGRHGFPKDFPSPEYASAMLAARINQPGIFTVVAEQGGRIVGSNLMDERSAIRGIGPISVDPAVQNGAIGRALMGAVLDRVVEAGAPGVRLMQDAYHNRSFALYTRLGFQMRVTTSVLEGEAFEFTLPGYEVRPATLDDIDACNRLCRLVHGHDRNGEVVDAVASGSARLVERDGRLTGYSTMIGFGGHAVASSNEDLMLLIAQRQPGARTSFHVPNSNGELLRWCYAHGLRMVKAMTLMTIGLYNEPAGPYIPSMQY